MLFAHSSEKFYTLFFVVFLGIQCYLNFLPKEDNTRADDAIF